MFKFRLAVALAVVCLLAVSTAAFAGGVMTLIEASLTMESEYQTLDTAVANCPNGGCPNAEDLAAELDCLGSEFANLQGEIMACGCSNSTLNSIVANIATLDSQLSSIIAGW